MKQAGKYELLGGPGARGRFRLLAVYCWYLVPGIWHLASGIWPLASGITHPITGLKGANHAWK